MSLFELLLKNVFIKYLVCVLNILKIFDMCQVELVVVANCGVVLVMVRENIVSIPFRNQLNALKDSFELLQP